MCHHKFMEQQKETGKTDQIIMKFKKISNRKVSHKISVQIKPLRRFWKLKNCKMLTTRSGPKDGRCASVTTKKKPARTWKRTDDTHLQMLFDKFENNEPGGFDHRDMSANNILLCQQQKIL